MKPERRPVEMDVSSSVCMKLGCACPCSMASGSSSTSWPASVRPLGSGRDGGCWLEIVLTEGRNRQVRRMCASVGHDVLELVRVAVGALALGDLAPGGWRTLAAADLAAVEADPR